MLFEHLAEPVEMLEKLKDIGDDKTLYYIEVPSESELSRVVDETLAYDGPAICTVKIYIGQKIMPRQTNYMKPDGQMASRPLEDMSPLLDREEYQSNMIIN